VTNDLEWTASAFIQHMAASSSSSAAAAAVPAAVSAS